MKSAGKNLSSRAERLGCFPTVNSPDFLQSVARSSVKSHERGQRQAEKRTALPGVSARPSVQIKPAHARNIVAGVEKAREVRDALAGRGKPVGHGEDLTVAKAGCVSISGDHEAAGKQGSRCVRVGPEGIRTDRLGPTL
jgi:hypothetical protein